MRMPMLTENIERTKVANRDVGFGGASPGSGILTSGDPIACQACHLACNLLPAGPAQAACHLACQLTVCR